MRIAPERYMQLRISLIRYVGSRLLKDIDIDELPKNGYEETMIGKMSHIANRILGQMLKSNI